MTAPVILIADDEADNVVLLEKRLRASGFETVAALDGNEAVAKTFASPPDLILLDIMMPGKDGYEVLRCLRGNDRTRDIPVILLTAKAETPDKVKGLELGAEDYVTKPFDYKELLARIHSHLDSKREVEQKIQVEKLVALSTMMDGVAHEVRNPLVVIGGFSKKLLAMTSGDDPRRTYIEAIQKEVVRLEQMIRDIYEFKTIRISRERRESVVERLRDVLASFAPAFEKNHITVTPSIDEHDLSISMDRENFSKAISNIIANAVDAMPDGGTLDIGTERGEKLFSISFADSGTGIREEDMRFIFDPFFTSKMEGTGLGLTLALKIIQAHDGQIAVKSARGKGTTVTIQMRTGDQ